MKKIGETISSTVVGSPPSRRRGLKKSEGEDDTTLTESPPSRRRGLKISVVAIIGVLIGRLLRGGVD